MSGGSNECTCPLEIDSSSREVSCEECLKFTVEKTDGEYCCVNCPRTTKLSSQSTCQAFVTLSPDSCPDPQNTCEFGASSFGALEVVISILSLLLLVIIIMTRTLWIPKLKRFIARYRRKATECPLKSRSEPNSSNGPQTNSSVRDLMAYHASNNNNNNEDSEEDDHIGMIPLTHDNLNNPGRFRDFMHLQSNSGNGVGEEGETESSVIYADAVVVDTQTVDSEMHNREEQGQQGQEPVSVLVPVPVGVAVTALL